MEIVRTTGYRTLPSRAVIRLAVQRNKFADLLSCARDAHCGSINSKIFVLSVSSDSRGSNQPVIQFEFPRGDPPTPASLCQLLPAMESWLSSAYRCQAVCNCLRLLMQLVAAARAFARE